MGTIGYAASMEQFAPSELLTFCQQAEDQGFAAVMASDHFNPWVPSQGQSGFVWSFMGALGATTSLRFGPGVTPPGYRYHPAIIAQAAATLEEMFPGRFYLGLGAGEALNEHIVAEYWPEAPVRLERLMESIEIINKLFTGKVVKHDGEYFTLESARLYTLPEERVPVYVATAGPLNAKRTGKYADGIITVGAADEKINMLWDKFREGAREAGKDPAAMRTQLQVHVSWAESQQAAEEQAVKEWPNGGMPFPKQDIKNPEDFANIAKLVSIENFANRMLISADLDEYVETLQNYVEMGFDEIYLHNVGRNQEAFIATFGEKVLPRLKLT